MEKKEITIEEVIREETEKRLTEMSAPDYEFPAKIGRGDIIAMVVGVVGSLILIGLCMIGVIQ